VPPLALSWQAQAAKPLEERIRTARSRSCTCGCFGARITRGVLRAYQGNRQQGPSSRGLRRSEPAQPEQAGETFYIKYRRSRARSAEPVGTGCLPSQISQVETILADRAIDAVSIVAGIKRPVLLQADHGLLIEDDCTTAHSTVLRDPQDRCRPQRSSSHPAGPVADRYNALFSTVMNTFTFRDANPALGIAARVNVVVASTPTRVRTPTAPRATATS